MTVSTRPHARRPHTLAPGEPTRHAPGLLNRAEWPKFAAAFFNKEPEANRVFAEIGSRFEVIEEMVTAELLAGAASPRVAFLTPGAPAGSCCGGYTWAATGPSISIAAYKEETVSKAGGANVDPTITAKCPLSGTKYQCANNTMLKEVTTLISCRPSIPPPLCLSLPALLYLLLSTSPRCSNRSTL